MAGAEKKPFEPDPDRTGVGTQTKPTIALGITPAAAKQAAYRLRKRYRQLFREEVACTVEDESEVDQEIGQLLATLGE